MADIKNSRNVIGQHVIANVVTTVFRARVVPGSHPSRVNRHAVTTAPIK